MQTVLKWRCPADRLWKGAELWEGLAWRHHWPTGLCLSCTRAPPLQCQSTKHLIALRKKILLSTFQICILKDIMNVSAIGDLQSERQLVNLATLLSRQDARSAFRARLWSMSKAEEKGALINLKWTWDSFIQCDQLKPACSRCSRLEIVCVGSGQQRYMFKEERRSWSPSSDQQPDHKQKISLGTQSQIKLPTLFRSPSSQTTLLTQSLVQHLEASHDLRYHLSWVYGGFIEDIPRRMGSNEALDAAVMALMSAHSSLALHRGTPPVTCSDSLSKYSHALKTLRIYLDDPIKAREAETLEAFRILDSWFLRLILRLFNSCI